MGIAHHEFTVGNAHPTNRRPVILVVTKHYGGLNHRMTQLRRVEGAVLRQRVQEKRVARGIFPDIPLRATPCVGQLSKLTVGGSGFPA